ncbi:ABC transporter permease [Thermohalobacter berrensis]|uniref:Glycine/betaine ABC transporter n=1 Tax=Thermohalobacter berrensis TaxID=99594 RepID=A0A419T2Z2_9FIRM|nr:ABC transporter permease [Thermohalobacter berrensis]RKD31778.1 glycine/betaine ABC transporter [Thermohalobacter berrensis]
MEKIIASIKDILVARWPQILDGTLGHIQLTLIALFFAVLIAVPLGIFLTRHRKFADPIIGVTSVFQTIPSLALLGFMIPILGIGKVPAVVALTIYGLLPILRNTYTGIIGVDKGVIEAGVGMGMTSRQILFMIEIPMALSVIMAGVRTASVLIVGVGTLASLIGAGGLGDLIFRGIATATTSLILAGAVPAAILALTFDYVLKSIEFKVTPRGLKK